VILSVDDDSIHQQLVSSMFRNGSYQAILFKTEKCWRKWPMKIDGLPIKNVNSQTWDLENWPYPPVICYIAMASWEMTHRNRWFTY